MIKTLLIKRNENEKDFCEASLFDGGSGALVCKLVDISKPNELSDYTDAWLQGLYKHYQTIAQVKFPNDNIVVNIL